MYQGFKKLIEVNAVWKLCVAGAAIPLAAALYNVKIQADLRKQPYYEDAMKLIAVYSPLNEYLGHPYTIKRIRRGATSNTRIGKDLVTLDIPVKGPKDRGVLLITANKQDDRWIVSQMDINLTNAKKEWTFYKCNSDQLEAFTGE